MTRLDAGKIGGLQGGWLVGSTIIPWGVLYIGALIMEEAAESAWMAPIPSLVIGTFIALLVCRLMRGFPGHTFVDVLCRVVGKPLASLLGVLYVLWFLTVAAATTRGFAELIISTILLQTPAEVVIISFLAVAFFGVRGGIEVLGRVTTTVGILVAFFLLLLFGVSARDLEPAYFTPVLEGGIAPVLRASYLATGFFGEVAVAAFVVLPFLDRPRQAPWVLGGALLGSTFLSILATLWYIGLFSARVAAEWTFPAIELVRYIEIADFFTRIEPVFIAGWVLINFGKLSVWYYAACSVLGQLVSLRDYRPLTLPVGVLIGILSVFCFRSLADFFEFSRVAATPFFLVFELLIPLLAWMVLLVRHLTGSPPADAFQESGASAHENTARGG